MRVQISARLIRWPQVCACCLGRADEVYRTTYTRVTGKKVIRTDSRWWQIPYCSDCLNHMDAEVRANAITSASAYSVLTLGIMLGLVVALFGSCCVGPALFAPAQPRAGKQEPAKPGQPNFPKSEPPKAGLVVVMVGSVLGGIVLSVGGYLWSQRLKADARDRRRRAMQHAESLASRSCCTLGSAVAYEGWYGSVHTFWFANADYADAFVQANPGKVLRG